MLVRTKTSKLRITLFALEFVRGDLPLFSLLFLVNLADLGDLLFARLLDAAQGFGPEVRGGSEMVRETEEVLEEGQGRGIVRGKLEGEVDALLGLGVVETM